MQQKTLSVVKFLMLCQVQALLKSYITHTQLYSVYSQALRFDNNGPCQFYLLNRNEFEFLFSAVFNQK